MKHLFICSSSSAGSTYLQNCLARCKYTISQYDETGALREGDYFVEDFAPCGWNTKHTIPRLWTEHPEIYCNSFFYDWFNIKANWREAWKRDPTYKQSIYKVFLEKSPTNTVRAHFLAKEFLNPYFIILVRDPYALAESNFRHLNMQEHQCNIPLERIVSHIKDCFVWNYTNMKTLPRVIFIRYEDIVTNPKKVSGQVLNLVPEISDLVFPNTKNGNINIAALSDLHRSVIKEGLKDYAQIFNYFGYTL